MLKLCGNFDRQKCGPENHQRVSGKIKKVKISNASRPDKCLNFGKAYYFHSGGIPISNPTTFRSACLEKAWIFFSSSILDMLHDFTHTGVIPVTFWKMKFQNVTATPPELNISIPLVGNVHYVYLFLLLAQPFTHHPSPLSLFFSSPTST